MLRRCLLGTVRFVFASAWLLVPLRTGTTCVNRKLLGLSMHVRLETDWQNEQLWLGTCLRQHSMDWRWFARWAAQCKCYMQVVVAGGGCRDGLRVRMHGLVGQIIMSLAMHTRVPRCAFQAATAQTSAKLCTRRGLCRAQNRCFCLRSKRILGLEGHIASLKPLPCNTRACIVITTTHTTTTMLCATMHIMRAITPPTYLARHHSFFGFTSPMSPWAAFSLPLPPACYSAKRFLHWLHLCPR